MPVENQLLSGSESEQENILVDDYEDVEQDEYEDELEYVEVEQVKQGIKNKKQLHLENDYSDEKEYQFNEENQIDQENNIKFEKEKRSKANLAAKRPIERAKEPLDIEPIEDKNLVFDEIKSETLEIDDPW